MTNRTKVEVSPYAQEVLDSAIDGLRKLAATLEKYDPASEADFEVTIDTVLGDRFNQSELAAEFRVSPGTISRWRAGKSCPPAYAREVIVRRIREMLLQVANSMRTRILHPVDSKVA